MNCRVFYRADGTVAVIHPVSKARRAGESEAEFYARVMEEAVTGTDLDGLPYDDIDPAALPTRADREKWRGSKGKGVTIDTSVVTSAERRKAVEDSLDAELAKETPDPVQVIGLRRQLDTGAY